jgi:hypothetical protein
VRAPRGRVHIHDKAMHPTVTRSHGANDTYFALLQMPRALAASFPSHVPEVPEIGEIWLTVSFRHCQDHSEENAKKRT